MSTIEQKTSDVPLTDVPTGPWLGEVWRHTMRSWAARLGVLWIAAVAFCAIFAPLLANSHPLAIKMNGQWSSPFLRFLTSADVILLFIGFVGLPWLLLYRGMRASQRLTILAAALVVLIPLVLLFVRPRANPVYEWYREAQANGQVEAVIYAPIPYSPSDRLRDQPLPDPPFPWAPSKAHWLGTDVNGQDIGSNMIHACRIAMAVGFISTGIAVAIGIVVGGLMGYFSGIVDLLGMRLVEVLAAIPTIYLPHRGPYPADAPSSPHQPSLNRGSSIRSP